MEGGKGCVLNIRGWHDKDHVSAEGIMWLCGIKELRL